MLKQRAEVAVAILTVCRFVSIPHFTWFQRRSMHKSHPGLQVTLTGLRSRSDAGHPQVSSTVLNPRASRPAVIYRCAW